MTATRQHLLAWVHAHGLAALDELFREEALVLVGPKGQHQAAPPASSSSAALSEVVADAGLLFPGGRPHGLRAHLRALLGDGALRQALIARGRTRVEREYTHAVIAAAQRDIDVHVLGHDL